MARTPGIDVYERRHDGERRSTLRVDLTDLALKGMSARQLADLRAATLLLRSAAIPDAFFHGHPSAGDDSMLGLWDRIAIVAALDDVQALPELHG